MAIETGTKIERNQMTMKKSFSLMTWLNSKKETPAWKTLTKENILELASKELGFEITYINLKSVAKACSVDLPVSRIPGGNSKTKNGSRHKITMLRKAVVELCNKLGEKVPEYILWQD